MNPFLAPLKFQNGAVLHNSRPVMLVSADYPYYRDAAENWRSRLSLMKSLGLQVVTCYIPWRHHQTDPGLPPDFTGATQPNRNVLEFLRLCQALELAVVVKPGPFIHAETNYGGLPDWVCPLINPSITALVDAQGNACLWGGAKLDEGGKKLEDWPLPAPFDPEFLRLARQWLAQVGGQVIHPFSAPRGPITAVQIANEGIYSNGQSAPWAYDYSTSSLDRYRRFVQHKYGSLSAYNRLHTPPISDWEEAPVPRTWEHPAGLAEMRRYIDWGEFQADTMAEIFGEWSRPLETSLPVVINQNPPQNAPYGLDAFLSRAEPEAWPGFHYGFTNWVGDVSARPGAFSRYLLAVKRAPGINWEENWGFAELYDAAYVDAAASFYQSLLILNNGAAGFNIYTGVATDQADANLVLNHSGAYPDAAPISESGIVTPKAEIARWLGSFMAAHGTEFLQSEPVQAAGWGFYLPYVRAAVWAATDETQGAVHGRHLADFQTQMRAAHLDYALLNLEAASLDELKALPQLFAAGSLFMAASVQQKLADYVTAGGKLNWIGSLPTTDENGQPCRILAGLENGVRVTPRVEVESVVADPAGIQASSAADLWLRVHPEKDIQFLTVLIPADGSSRVEVDFTLSGRGHRLVLSAAPSGGGIFRLEGGKVTSYIIKGANTFLDQIVAPLCRFDGEDVGLNIPGDCARINGRVSSIQPQPL